MGSGHDGFGLGLALVSSIACVHNGTVHAPAPLAGGLDVTVRVPRRDSQPHGSRNAAAAAHDGMLADGAV